MITVIDYGAGNLRSVCNALTVIGAEFQVSSERGGVERAAAILLPGVGHFAQMIDALKAAGMLEPLRERLRAGVPYLGICLGMQALFESSEEAPDSAGFGLLPGAVCRFPNAGGTPAALGQAGRPRSKLRVPHMGWTAVEAAPGAQLAAPGMFYFAHSYYVPAVGPGAAGIARHGLPFVAVVEHASLAGCQFHPEKSGPAGLDFLKRWITKCRPNA